MFEILSRPLFMHAVWWDLFFLLQIRRQLSLKCRVRMSTLFKALIINALNMFKITQNKC